MKRLGRALLLAFLLTVIFVPMAAAEGPGTGGRRVMIDDERVGPYLVRVVTSPTPPRVEALYVEVRVLDPQTQQPISDAEVQTRAEPTEGQAEPVESAATHDIAPIPTEYAAHLPVGEPGVWRVTVTINNEHQIEFLTRVGGSTAVGSVLAIGLPIAGLAVLIGVFLYLNQQSKSEGQ